MTKEKRNDGIYIACTGTYVGAVGGTPTKKPFEIEIQLTNDPNYVLPGRDDKILYLAQKKLVPNYFRENHKEYPDYRRWYECRVEDVIIVNNGKEVEAEEATDPEDIDFSKMKRKELVKFCTLNGLLTDPTSHATIGAARKEVSDEWENKLIAEQDAVGLAEKQKEKEVDSLAEFSDILDFNNIK